MNFLLNPFLVLADSNFSTNLDLKLTRRENKSSAIHPINWYMLSEKMAIKYFLVHVSGIIGKTMLMDGQLATVCMCYRRKSAGKFTYSI